MAGIRMLRNKNKVDDWFLHSSWSLLLHFLGFKKCCTCRGSWSGEVCQGCNERKENWTEGYRVRLEPEHKFFVADNSDFLACSCSCLKSHNI